MKKKYLSIFFLFLLLGTLCFAQNSNVKVNEEVITKYYSTNSGLFKKNFVGLQFEIFEEINNNYSFSTDNKVFLKEVICFNVIPNSAGFLYVINEGTSGKLSMIFPERLTIEPLNKLIAGRSYKIPENKNWTFAANSGRDILYIIFSKERLKDLESNFEKGISKAELANFIEKGISESEIESINTDFGKFKRKFNYAVTEEGNILITPLILSHTNEGIINNSTQQNIQNILQNLNKEKK